MVGNATGVGACRYRTLIRCWLLLNGLLARLVTGVTCVRPVTSGHEPRKK